MRSSRARMWDPPPILVTSAIFDRWNLMPRRQAWVRTGILAAAITLGGPTAAFGEETATPDIVADVMAHLGFGPANRASLEAGEILFTGRPDLETLPQGIAVAGAMMLVGRPPAELADAYLSNDVLRSHSDVLAAGSIPASGGDTGVLTSLEFGEGEAREIQRLRRAKAGDAYNLSPSELELLSGIASDDLLLEAYRDALWQRLDAYRSAGLGGIPPYARKKQQLSDPAEEMQAALASAEWLRTHFPDMHAALVNYPGSMEPLSESRLIWIKKTVAKRPLVALAHRLLLIDGDVAIVAEREYYVGHTYNSMLTIAAVVPYGDGSLVFAANRTFSEKVEGAAFKKNMGRKAVAKGFSKRLEELRAEVMATPSETVER